MKLKGSASWSKRIFKAGILIAGAAMTMGNQKCEQQEQEPPRVLKKIVEMGAVRSSPLVLPNGTFDFQFVANQQIYGVLLDSKEFTLRYAPPIATPPDSLSNGSEVFFNLTKADGQMMKAFSQAVGKDNYNVQYAKTAWCMVNLPQAKIAGSVNSFELIGGGGLTLGFTPNGAHSTSGLTSAGLNVEFAQLDLSLMALRPLTSKVMSAANVTSKQTKTKVSFGLNFGAFSVGPSAYYQTPLAKVTKNALVKAVDELSTSLKEEEWYTRVIANHDTHLVVVGGVDVGLEAGDQLLVYNEDYYWEGEPCNSKYLGGGAAAGSAVAKIEIDWVGDEISRGRIVEQNDNNAVIGSKVKLFKLHAEDYQGQDAGVQQAVDSSETIAQQTQNSTKPTR